MTIPWFRRVTFTCTHCGEAQSIPLRRVHAFERFHQLRRGQAVLIRCSHCVHGLQFPSPYTSCTGHVVAFDPRDPAQDAFIHETCR